MPLDLGSEGNRLRSVQGVARGELAADGDVSSFVHVDDVPAAGREWVPAFCRAVGRWSPWRLAVSGMGGLGALTTGTRARS